MGRKQQAMQSFAMASSEGYDDAISEDALFNYGKLQYELGGGYFNEAINVLNRYIARYPNSDVFRRSRSISPRPTTIRVITMPPIRPSCRYPIRTTT